MALMDEFKEEREQIKNGPLKQRAAYFWEYYKWYVIVPTIIIIAIVWYIHHIVTAPEDALNGLFINTYNAEAQDSSDALAADFAKEQKINTDDYSVTLNASVSYIANDTSGTANYETSQALMAWVAAGSVDFMAGDFDSLTELAYREYFIDLRDVLSEEELAQYEPYFLYIDQAVIEARAKALNENLSDVPMEYPDCSKPETMEEPIPILIDLSKTETLAKVYSDSEHLAFGFVQNMPHKELTIDFLDYITE